MSDFQPPIVDHHAPEVPDPTYESPTLTEIVDIIDLLRPWMHGFNLVTTPTESGVGPWHRVVCDCGWTTSPSTEPMAMIVSRYQNHIGYEE